MSSKLASMVGQTLGGFELSALLGEGGMAAVFRGENLLDRSILRAIKVLHPQLSADEEFTRRFAEEARVLERLQHPNIVRFYGARWEGELLLMELELLRGRVLASFGKGEGAGPVSHDRAADWLLQASEGLAAAHDLDIIHRDLKPDNLFLTEGGVVKILDFGIARALDETDRASPLTRAGTVPGTPAYLAPEVCQLGVPSRQSDIYALGMTFYELILGHHPFMPPGHARRSSTEVMFAQVQEPLPDLAATRPGLPPSLARTLARATSKDPALRYASARELVLELRSGGAAPAPASSPPPTSTATSSATTATPTPIPTQRALATTAGPASRRRAAPFLAVGLVVVLGGAAAGAWLLSSRTAPPRSQASAGAPPAEQRPAPPPRPTAEAPAGSSAAGPVASNRFVVVEPPRARVLLGVDEARTVKRERTGLTGFRPGAGVVAPSARYEIQEHEVTWGELDPWLARSPGQLLVPPPFAPSDPPTRARTPASSVPWPTARAYCRSLGADLPTEEQWEYAARGAEARPAPWGSAPLDLGRTNAYQGPSGRARAIMQSDQDRTPGGDRSAIHDLAGNVQEWTLDLYRSDGDGKVDTWVQTPKRRFRAVRGLPLDQKPPRSLPREPAAYRGALCAEGSCPRGVEEALRLVGFRCARTLTDAR
jgi:eukaryotic-like serine/threonine-protein kinase